MKNIIIMNNKGVKQPIDKSFYEVVTSEISTQLDCVPDDVYMVWWAKTLGNCKGLFSSDVLLADGVYYEATYNGATQDLYLDKYHKHENTCFKIIGGL